MKCSQNKLILKEFPNILSKAKQFLIFLLKWSSLFHCAQEQLYGKMEETHCTLSLLQSKLEIYFKNKTQELYMVRLKGRRHTTPKRIFN